MEPSAAVPPAKATPTTPEAPSTPIRPVGQIRLASSVRTAAAVRTHDPEPPTTEQPVGPPLTQQSLQEAWQHLLDDLAASNPDLHRLLDGREVRLAKDDFIQIVGDSTHLKEELRPHQVALFQTLRTATRRPALNGEVIVEYVERETVPYAPRDKYEALVAANPVLETFHVLFPEIDL